MSAEQNKQLVARFNEEFWAKGNLEIADELVADNFIDHDPFPGFDHSRDAWKYIYNEMKKGLVVLDYQVVGPYAEGDKVFSYWKFITKREGEYFGVPGNGEEYMMEGIDIYRIENGKLAEVWNCVNKFGMMVQLGLLDPTKLPCANVESCKQN